MSLIDKSIADFTTLLASDLPAPGSGAASALQGAVGASLIGMVASLTAGRTEYEEHEHLMRDVLKRSDELREFSLDIIERDTEIFSMVNSVLSMPNKTHEDKDARFLAMQDAMKSCALTSYEMMECAYGMLELAMVMLGKYNMSAASEFGIAVLSIKSSAQGAWLNVLTNLEGLRDEIFSAKYTMSGNELIENITELADYIHEDILNKLSGGRFS